MRTLKRMIRILQQFLRLMAEDPRRLVQFPGAVLGFLSDKGKFQKLARDSSLHPRIVSSPVFFQKGIASTFDAHYVYQAAWAIRRIVALAPNEHFDISSNIPYVAALSAVVKVRFCEFRPPLIELPGLTTEHVDITALPFPSGSVKSLSCLHVLEHVGLGRYGDTVDARGLEKACAEIGRVIDKGGNIFLSLPVGREEVVFNMHRVSDPGYLSLVFGDSFELVEFSVVTDDRRYLEKQNPANFREQKYACGLYWLRKR